MGWPLVYTHSIIFTRGPRLIKYSNFLNFKETPQESDVNPISKYQTRQVWLHYAKFLSLIKDINQTIFYNY